MADISKVKINDTTYNIKDATARSRIPAGGSTNYVLAKSSATDYAVSWQQVNYNNLSNRPTLGGIHVRPDYTVSTTDLTDGTSALATGKLYFVYEE